MGRAGGVGAAVTGESVGLPGERRRDSPATCEGDGDNGTVGSCVLLSFSPVENETVFLRFLRGGTRTIGDDGRGYGGDGGRLEDAIVVSALLSLASPEGKKSNIYNISVCCKLYSLLRYCGLQHEGKKGSSSRLCQPFNDIQNKA